mgnify:CR=1 FL=1
MTDDPLKQLSRALEATEVVVAGIGADQWTDPTPCTDWNVAQLAHHLISGNGGFTRALGGDTPSGADDQDVLAAYRDSAAALLSAFSQPGALERVVTVPFGSVPGMVALHLRVTEVLVHGWDLARATGQPARFPEDVAEQELAFTRAKLGDVPPDRSPFAAPQPVSDSAPAIDRLAACLGRAVDDE